MNEGMGMEELNNIVLKEMTEKTQTIESLTREKEGLSRIIESLTREKEELLQYKSICCKLEVEEVLKKYSMDMAPAPGIQLIRKQT